MARKRQVIENPPPADSSSEEEQESSQENDAVQDDSEHEHEHEEEENDAVAEEEEEEDDEDEDEEEEESPVKKSTDSDLDSDSDGTQPSPTASGFTIKPIISKPLDDVTKPKKPVSKSGSKRPAETDPVEPESKNKKKKKSSNDNSNSNSNNEEAKKVSGGTQRVWSEDDEIALLKGMSENRTLKGSDPADMGVFYEYIKKSMHFDLSKTQLVDKIRRLKKKYQNNVQKGQDPVFAKPHEERAFLLSKKIWGGEVTNGNVNNNNVVVVDAAAGNSKKKVKQISTTSASGGGGNSKVVGSVTLALPSGNNSVFNHDVKLDGEKNGELKSDDSGDFWSSFPCLNGSFEIGKVLALPEFGKSFLKGRMSLIGSDKAGELEEKWRNLQEEELKLYLKRVELVKQQGELALETIRASRS